MEYQHFEQPENDLMDPLGLQIDVLAKQSYRLYWLMQGYPATELILLKFYYQLKLSKEG